jgi:2-desacetyl-2-hydroxyethyl bacteriochlorophyllide A dehydrogenase
MSNNRKKMKAIIMEEFGGPEELKMSLLDAPEPAPNEVQIQIEYAAVNPVDWKIRKGLLKQRMPYAFPIIPGWDASGTISAVGKNVTQYKMGDTVFAYCRKPTIQWGTYAEYICVDANNVAHKPSNISFAQAAAIPLAGLTAWQSLFDTAQLKKGETLLIHAGAGGVGSLAIQFAKEAGAHILTTAAEEKHTYVKDLGADVAIDYKKQNFVQEVKKLYPQGIDLIFDTVGGQTYKDSFQLLKPGGRITSLIEQPNQELADKYKVKPFYLFVQPNGEELEKIGKLVQERKVKPILIEEMPLEQAAKAQQKNEEGHTFGKIVLKIN